SRAASSRRAMVPGPPPARSVRITLRLTTSLALRSSKQSIPRDFSSGAWSRKPKRPEAKALTETPARSGCAASRGIEDDAAHSVNSPPPWGGGLGVGVRQRITARPPPRRFAPTLPSRLRACPLPADLQATKPRQAGFGWGG